MDEFTLIDRLVSALNGQDAGPAVVLGPGDDAAVLRVQEGVELVGSLDTLVADVHFPVSAPPLLIGYRAMMVSLSDLAAMGAQPHYALVGLTLPRNDVEWVQQLARGMSLASAAADCPLPGGNLARGPLNISVSVHGTVPAGQALRRSGAQPGDLIMVSGDLGGAAMALQLPELDQPPSFAELNKLGPADELYALRRYFLPEARIELGMALRGLASSVIDVSDGLLADLGHLCSAGGVGARLELSTLPALQGAGLSRVLTGGDDYELCFTLPPASRQAVTDVAGRLGIPLSEIGRIEPGSQLVLYEQGQLYAEPYELAPSADTSGRGFRHF